MKILATCFACKEKVILKANYCYLMQTTRYEHHPVSIFVMGREISCANSDHQCLRGIEIFCAELVISPFGRAFNWRFLEPNYYPQVPDIKEVSFQILKSYIQDYVRYISGKTIILLNTPSKTLNTRPAEDGPYVPPTPNITVSGTTLAYYPNYENFFGTTTATTTVTDTRYVTYEMSADALADALNTTTQTTTIETVNTTTRT